MAKVMREAVAVRNPETGQVEVLLPGSDAPDWAVKEIDNESVFEPTKAAAKR